MIKYKKIVNIDACFELFLYSYCSIYILKFYLIFVNKLNISANKN